MKYYEISALEMIENFSKIKNDWVDNGVFVTCYAKISDKRISVQIDFMIKIW